jgi:hypothetical protein
MSGIEGAIISESVFDGIILPLTHTVNPHIVFDIRYARRS